MEQNPGLNNARLETTAQILLVVLFHLGFTESPGFNQFPVQVNAPFGSIRTDCMEVEVGIGGTGMGIVQLKKHTLLLLEALQRLLKFSTMLQADEGLRRGRDGFQMAFPAQTATPVFYEAAKAFQWRK